MSLGRLNCIHISLALQIAKPSEENVDHRVDTPHDTGRGSEGVLAVLKKMR